MRAVGAHQQCVTVGRRLRHIGRRDAAIGALAVVDHDVLVERDPQRLRDDAGYDVGTAAGAKRNDDCDRSAWIGVRSQRRMLAGRNRVRKSTANQSNSNDVPPLHFTLASEKSSLMLQPQAHTTIPLHEKSLYIPGIRGRTSQIRATPQPLISDL